MPDGMAEVWHRVSFLLIFCRRSRLGFAKAAQGWVDAMGFLEVGHQRCQRDFYGHALPQQQPWELTLHRMHYQGHVWPLELVPTLPLQPIPAAQEKTPHQMAAHHWPPTPWPGAAEGRS